VAGTVRALLALLLFVPFAMAMFQRKPRATAASIVFLCGIGFLPEQAAFDLPTLPPIGKEYLTYLCALAGGMIYRAKSIASARPGRGLEALVVLMLVENIITAFMNPDPMWDEGKLEAGLGIWDVVAKTGDDALGIALPYFVGRALFRTRQDALVLMRTLGMVGLVYTVLIVIEVAGSIPFKVFQLGERVYGIRQQPLWRWGVIQPVVFLDNGLSVATFMAACLIAVAALIKIRVEWLPIRATRARLAVAFGLLMTRSVAGNVYGHVLTLCFALLKARTIAAIGLGLVTLSCTYPALRTADLFPNRKLVEFAQGLDRERARSLSGRFDEEDFVLEGLGEKYWFGWGNYVRTPGAETFGVGEVGIDGWWVNRIGTHGIIGVQLHYAIFGWPVFLAWRRMRRLRDPVLMALLAALMVMVGMRSVDLLLNGWWNSLPVFFAGVLTGVSSSIGRGPPPAMSTALAAPRFEPSSSRDA